MSCYLPLPPKLECIQAFVNVRNNDNRSFEYSILADLFPAKKNKTRCSIYKKHLPKLIMNGIENPVKLRDVPLFEDLNSEYKQRELRL